jgi:hypothetical protein
LTLTIDCRYLAERIDKTFNSFFVELNNVELIELLTWPNPFHLPVVIKTDLDDIFKAPLEIEYANVKDGKVVVDCSQHDNSFDYCGGNLSVSCETIRVYDQQRNSLTIEALDEICKAYWNEASNRI